MGCAGLAPPWGAQVLLAQPCPRWPKAAVERDQLQELLPWTGPESGEAPVVLVRRSGSGAAGGEGRLPSFGALPAALPLQSLGPCCRRTGKA